MKTARGEKSYATVPLTYVSLDLCNAETVTADLILPFSSKQHNTTLFSSDNTVYTFAMYPIYIYVTVVLYVNPKFMFNLVHN
jgi:hypothetical protein